MPCSSTRAYIYPGHAVISARVVYTRVRVQRTESSLVPASTFLFPYYPLQCPHWLSYRTRHQYPNCTILYGIAVITHTRSLQPHSSNSSDNYSSTVHQQVHPHTHTQNRCSIPRALAANRVGAQAQAPLLHFLHAISLVLLFQGIGQMVIQGPLRIQEISCTTYTKHPAPTPRACQLSPHHPRRHIIRRKNRAVYQILQTHNQAVSTLYLLTLQVLLLLTRVANHASAVFAPRKIAAALSFHPPAANQHILGHLRKVKIWEAPTQGVLQNKPYATKKRYNVAIWTIRYQRRTLLPIKQSILRPRSSHHKASRRIQ